jgi:nucleotide-binding universal stress UspA family protein
MSTAGRRGSVVVGVDGSPASASAVEWAAALAGREGWPLTLVNAYPDLNSPPVRGFYVPEHEMQADAHRITDEVQECLRDAGWAAIDVRTEVDRGYPADVLAQQSGDARMLVVGRRGGGGFVGMLVGSTAFAAAELARVPTIIVPDDWTPVANDDRPIVVGLAGAHDGAEAVDFAFDLASRLHVQLRAVQAFDPVTVPMVSAVDRSGYQEWTAAYERALAEELAGWTTKYPDVEVDRQVVDEHPVACLLDKSREAQLMVVGGRRHTRLGGALVGSTARSLMHHAECPLAVVHPEK